MAPTKLKPSAAKNGKKKSPVLLDLIVEQFSKGAVCATAAAVAGIGRSTLMDWRQTDPEFNKRCLEAIDAGVDLMEAEARRRAVDGYERPVYQQGELVGTVIEYSDTLMTLMLKGRRPDVFNRDRVEHSGPNGKAIEHKIEVEFVSGVRKDDD